ncbi:MAG: hypothetical protein H6Q58_355 [Firmicutes bacterium]|nr:hypothetical protein [Bacillota bacterium]
MSKEMGLCQEGWNRGIIFVPFMVEVFLFYKRIIAMTKRSSVESFFREAVVGVNGRKSNAKGALER